MLRRGTVRIPLRQAISFVWPVRSLRGRHKGREGHKGFTGHKGSALSDSHWTVGFVLAHARLLFPAVGFFRGPLRFWLLAFWPTDCPWTRRVSFVSFVSFVSLVSL